MEGNAAHRALLEKSIADLMCQKQCVRCGSLFTEMAAHGAWSCRVHPGTFQGAGAAVWGTDRDTFSCCNTSPWPTHRLYPGRELAAGCTPCDHTIHAGLPDTLVIPLERAAVLFGDRLYDGRRPGIRVRPDEGIVYIFGYSGDAL